MLPGQMNRKFRLSDLFAAVMRPLKGHHHRRLAGGQKLHRLSAALEEEQIRLDRLKLGEGPVHAFRSPQRVIDLVGRNTVRHQGDLESIFRALADGALAGKALGVEEVRDRGRGGIEAILVVTDARRPHHRADAAFAHALRDQPVLLLDLRPIDRLVEALGASDLDLLRLALDHVPARITAGLDAGADRSDAAVPGIVHDLAAGFGSERREERLTLAVRHGAAPGYDGEIASDCRLSDSGRQCHGQQR